MQRAAIVGADLPYFGACQFLAIKVTRQAERIAGWTQENPHQGQILQAGQKQLQEAKLCLLCAEWELEHSCRMP